MINLGWLDCVSADVLRVCCTDWCVFVDLYCLHWATRAHPLLDKWHNCAGPLPSEVLNIFRRVLLPPSIPYCYTPHGQMTHTHILADVDQLSFCEEMQLVPPKLDFPFLTKADLYPWLRQQRDHPITLMVEDVGFVRSWLDYPSIPSVTKLYVVNQLINEAQWKVPSVWANVTDLTWCSYSDQPLPLSSFPSLQRLCVAGEGRVDGWESAHQLREVYMNTLEHRFPPTKAIPQVTTWRVCVNNPKWMMFLTLQQAPFVEELELFGSNPARNLSLTTFPNLRVWKSRCSMLNCGENITCVETSVQILNN